MAYLTTQVRLPDLASWERAKAGKVYPAGCTLLQISATRGQLVYLGQERTVDSRYAVIQPKAVSGFYLFCLLESQMPDFLRTHQTGLNIQPAVLNEMEVTHYPDPAVQKEIEMILAFKNSQIESEEAQIKKLTELKRYLLGNCFPGSGRDEPDFRF